MLRRNSSGDRASRGNGRERSPCWRDGFVLGATLCLCVGKPNTVVRVCQMQSVRRSSTQKRKRDHASSNVTKKIDGSVVKNVIDRMVLR